MKKIGCIIFAVLLILAIGAFALFYFKFLKLPKMNIPPEAPIAKKIEILDQWFESLLKEEKFNGVVLIAKNGEKLLSKGYGFADYQRTKQLSENSALRLASVSKQFTAAGVMLLHENNLIEYDDLVTKYVSDFPYQGVTIRHLLNQTSGLPDIYVELENIGKEGISFLTNEIVLDLLIKEKIAPTGAPNEAYQYCNTNYILLAHLIEIITEKSFESYMKTEMFEPLGMENTRVWNRNSTETIFKNKADDFDLFSEKPTLLEPTFYDGVAGDGAVFSSITDLLKWDQFWYENPLISPANLQEAFKKPTLNNGEKSDYGFGWLTTENGMWHNGTWMGANTIIIRNVKKKSCTVILDNSSNLLFDKILDELGTVEFN